MNIENHIPMILRIMVTNGFMLNMQILRYLFPKKKK